MHNRQITGKRKNFKPNEPFHNSIKMLSDYEILKYLGLELQDQSIVFYEDELEEHLIKLTDIKEITIEEAFIPIENKVGFWINKLFLVQQKFGIPDFKANMEDYQDIYELEIELKDNRVLSRKVKGIELYKIEEFLNKFNELIKNAL